MPNELSFSDFRGYVPRNGKAFPDGSKIAKIEWKPKKSTAAPFSVRVPDVWQDVFLIEKDTKRFPDTKGWAYAAF
ncbi:MAG: cytochrome P460 family protein [Bryobacteraceae bacterium]